MNKKKIIVIIVLVCLIVIGGIVSIFTQTDNKTSEYQSEFTMVVETRKFLKTKVNYPETFDYVNYPDVTWYNDEIVYVIISGDFKSANAFGVYISHKFAVAMNPKNCEIISYKIV